MRKWNLIPYILKPSLAVFAIYFPHQVILNSPWSLVKEPYDLSQNSPFLLWKKLLVQISMSSHIYLKRKMTQGLNGRMVQSTTNIKYIKRNLHLNARVWTGEWSAILLKIYIKKQKPLSLSIWTNYPGSERKNGMPASCTWSRQVWWAHAFTPGFFIFYFYLFLVKQASPIILMSIGLTQWTFYCQAG